MASISDVYGSNYQRQSKIDAIKSNIKVIISKLAHGSSSLYSRKTTVSKS